MRYRHRFSSSCIPSDGCLAVDRYVDVGHLHGWSRGSYGLFDEWGLIRTDGRGILGARAGNGLALSGSRWLRASESAISESFIRVERLLS